MTLLFGALGLQLEVNRQDVECDLKCEPYTRGHKVPVIMYPEMADFAVILHLVILQD